VNEAPDKLLPKPVPFDCINIKTTIEAETKICVNKSISFIAPVIIANSKQNDRFTSLHFEIDIKFQVHLGRNSMLAKQNVKN
ncbi:MAG: hypothetical protein US62_C0050G0001, partial [Candidatus Woesebacteria bacterium GW2011_GWA1_37_8]